MKTLTALLFFIFTSQISNAQFNEQWEQRFNGAGNFNDAAVSIKIDLSKNVYVSGNSFGSSFLFDYITIKYNTSGIQEWAKIYNGPGNDNDYLTASISHNSYLYVTGLSSAGSSYDYATIKYDNLGNEVWVARYNGTASSNDAASSIAVDNSENVYVTGRSYGGTASSLDFATVKYNSAGIQQWAVRYNGTGSSTDESNAIFVDTFQNVFITGQSVGAGSNLDYTTIKYNSSGVEQWVARYNGPANDVDVSRSILVNNTGDIYVTGYSRGTGTSYDYTTIKYDNSGNQVWVSRYNGTASSSDIPSSMVLDHSGNVIITGVTNSDVSGSLSNYSTIKYNPSGTMQWAAIYNGTGNSNDSASALFLDDSGNVFVTGKSTGSGTSFDFLTIEYSPEGVPKFSSRYNSSGISKDAATSVIIDESGNTYVTGSSVLSGGFEDILTIKYSKVSGINTISSQIPDNYELLQNYPNPFNPVTSINYSIRTNGLTKLTVFDLSGNEVTSLVNEIQSEGTYNVIWNAENFPSGIYYYRLEANNFTDTKKMLLVK